MNAHAPLSPAEEALIIAHRQADAAELALRLRAQGDVRLAVVATQVALRQHLANKVPSWVQAGCYLDRQTAEQATDEALAQLRFRALSGALAWDLSGGMGVDTHALAHRFAQVVYVEADAARCEAAAWNFQKLGQHNIQVVCSTAEDFLARQQGEGGAQPDFCYVDPDRRASGKRALGLAGLSPDPLTIVPQLLQHAAKVGMKLSPMLDADAAMRALPLIESIEAMGTDGECKELLLWLGRDATAKPKRQARGIWQGRVYCVTEDPGLATPPPHETQLSDLASGWLYEPDAAIGKLRLLREAAATLLQGDATMTHPDGYAHSGRLERNWPGRVWRIIAAVPFQKAGLRAYVQANDIGQVQLTSRHFDLALAAVGKMLGIPTNGSHTLLLTTDSRGKRWAFHVERANAQSA